MSISSAIRASLATLATLGGFINQPATDTPPSRAKATRGASGEPQGPKRKNRRGAFGPKVTLGKSRAEVPELRKRKSDQDARVLAQQQDAVHRDWMKTRVE